MNRRLAKRDREREREFQIELVLKFDFNAKCTPSLPSPPCTCLATDAVTFIN